MWSTEQIEYVMEALDVLHTAASCLVWAAFAFLGHCWYRLMMKGNKWDLGGG